MKSIDAYKLRCAALITMQSSGKALQEMKRITPEAQARHDENRARFNRADAEYIRLRNEEMQEA